MSHKILYRDMSVIYCTRIWLLSWISLLLILKPTCSRKCLMTYFTGIRLWHTVQVYGFSPERVFCWSLNLYALNKNVSRHSLQGFVCHTVQGYGFSPEWVFCWFLNLLALENVSQHSLQGQVCDILYKYMASLLNESFVDS